MKAYFFIKDLLNEVSTIDGNKYLVKIQDVIRNGLSVLGPVYAIETTNIAYDSTAFELSDCSDNGTSIDACQLGGLPDSWNPFYANLNAIYDNVVNSQNRGAFLQSNSGFLYGLEGYGFGFDKIDVPINDIPSGGSSGAVARGGFFVNFDESVDFQFVIKVQKETAGGSVIYLKYHTYTWTASTCSFSYEIATDGDPTIVDATPFAFLSGGLGGWVDFGCGLSGNDLGDDPIVTQSICTVPSQIFTPTTIVSETLNECCYQSLVLASSTDNDEWKNDLNGFLFKRNFSSETITLVLEKNGGAGSGGVDITLNDNTYGTYYNFGAFADYPNYKGYQLEWQNVLLTQGEGIYRLRVDYALISGNVTQYSIPFTLKEYSQDRANGTFRIQTVMNGYLKKTDFNYKGLNWVDGLRIRGFFGNRQAEYEQENVIYTNRQSRQVRSELLNTYTCQTMLVPDCISDVILEYHNFANKVLFTDYNLNNHKKTYIQTAVVFDSVDSIEYNPQSTNVQITLKYKDYVQNYQKTNC